MLLGSSDLNTDADCQPIIAAAAPTADRPWVEIRNTCSTPQSLDTTVLRWAGDDFGWGATALSGALAPGECTLVTDFDQPLIEGECGAAFALFSVFDDALTASPWSEVWYGDVECSTDVERPTSTEHIELQGDAWVVVQGTAPTCAKAPPTVPPVIIPAPLCAPLDEQGKAYCEAHPWGRAPGCKEEQSAAECLSILEPLADCGFSTCEYEACANALAEATCTARPKVCDEIVECLNSGNDPPLSDTHVKPSSFKLSLTTCPGTESIKDTAAWCEAHPWGRPSECGGAGPSEAACVDMLDLFEGCGVTQCEFSTCAAALATAPCGTTPPECAGISSCVYSSVPVPVLPVLRTCAPDPDVCSQLTDACIEDGLDAATCVAFGQNVCPSGEYVACEAVTRMCEGESSTCEAISKVCTANFDACQAPACKATKDLSAAESVGFCFAYPARLEGCGATPDIGTCMEMLTWNGCDVTTCEWKTCMADLAALDQCPVKLPASCSGVEKCAL